MLTEWLLHEFQKPDTQNVCAKLNLLEIFTVSCVL